MKKPKVEGKRRKESTGTVPKEKRPGAKAEREQKRAEGEQKHPASVGAFLSPRDGVEHNKIEKRASYQPRCAGRTRASPRA